jgi:serine/threonine-protein kinase
MDGAGRLVGERYRLLEAAGRGGMAEVWRAEDVVAGGCVAVKRILPSLAQDPAMHALFADEARITAALAHPNVVRVEGHGRDAAGPYLALEWIEGMPLRELLDRHGSALSVAAGLSIALDVLKGLAAAHELRVAGARLPVIHRDLSPCNVLVSVAGAAKLADFGLARSLAHPRTNARGTARGKVAYLPPEVIRGAPHAVRGDVYGAGVLVWEALAGRRLFPGGADKVRTVLAILREARTPLREARPEVPEALARVVDRAVARDPAERPASARAMAEALAEAADRAGLAPSGDAVAEAMRAALARRDGAPSAAERSASPPSVSREVEREVDGLLASAMAAIAAA